LLETRAKLNHILLFPHIIATQNFSTKVPMKFKSRGPVSGVELRKMAVEALLKNPPQESDLKTGDLLKLVHELQVYKTEVEMQNEELRVAHEELLASRDRYAQLYDLAPTGYLTLSTDLCIEEANNPAMNMLGLKREAINTGSIKFSSIVASESQDEWHKFSRTIFENDEKKRCELILRAAENTRLIVLLESIAVKEGFNVVGQCMVALIDITGRKKVEGELEIYRHNLEHIVKQRTGQLEAARTQAENDARELRESEGRLRTANKELTLFNNAVVGRELRMIELKKEINELCQKYGEPKRYGQEPEKDKE